MRVLVVNRSLPISSFWQWLHDNTSVSPMSEILFIAHPQNVPGGWAAQSVGTEHAALLAEANIDLCERLCWHDPMCSTNAAATTSHRPPINTRTLPKHGQILASGLPAVCFLSPSPLLSCGFDAAEPHIRSPLRAAGTKIPHARRHRARKGGTNLYRGISQPGHYAVHPPRSAGITSLADGRNSVTCTLD